MLRSQGSTERVPPLHGSDSPFEHAPADLPLREDVPASPVARAEMFSTPSGPEKSGPGMVRVWLVAAVALVIGIVIGFASGFTAAGRVTAPAVAEAPETAAEASSSGRPFSEAAVAPTRVEPEPVVPTTEPEVQKATAPAPTSRPVARARSNSPAPPAAPASPASLAPPAPSERTARVEGPGSMQIVSRPAGAQVILDGRNVGRTPLTLASVPDGPHAVRLELPEFKQWATTVEVTPGQRTRVAASLEQ